MSLASRASLCLLALILNLISPLLIERKSASSVLAAQHSDEEADLRALAEYYFRAWSSEDIDGYMKLWASSSPDLESRKQAMQKLFADYEQIEIKPPLIHKVTRQGDRAILRLDMEISAVDVKTGKPAKGFGLRRRVMECVRENGAWRVLREESAFEALARKLAATADPKERDRLLAGEKDLWLYDLTLAVNRVGIRLASLGLYPEAMNVFRIAQSTAETINDLEGLAASLGNIGLIHSNQGDYDLALEPIQKSLRLAESRNDQAVASRAWNSLGLVYQGQGDFNRSLESYRKCLEIAQIQQDTSLIPMVLGNIGNLYNSRSDYRLASEYYQKSQTYYREQGVKAGEGRILNSLGNIQYYQGNLDLALQFYKESLALKVETGNVVEQARTMNALGRLYTLQGKYDLAEEFHRKSLAINEASDTKVDLARTLSFLGDTYLMKGDHSSALEYYEKSLNINEAIGYKRGEGDSLNQMADAYLIQGKSAQALEASERATEIAKQIGNLEGLWTALTQTGKAHNRLARPTQAHKSFEEAIATIESLRTRMAGGEQEARRYFETKISPYYELAELLVDQNRFGEALVYAELAKARALLDVLQHGRVGIQKAMTTEEAEQERLLKSDLIMLNLQLTRATQADKPDTQRIEAIKSRLEKARLNYEAFQTSLYAAHPELKVKRGEAPIINPEEIAALLPDTAGALLEYVVTDDKTYLFAITKAVGKAKPEIQVYSLPIKRNDLAKQVEAFRGQLARRDLGFRTAAAGLYNLLLKPAATQIQGKTSLVIVADDMLWDLPFQALLTGANRFLIEDAAIAYAPSLTALREMTTRRKDQRPTAATTLLALGNPQIGKETVKRATLTPRDERLDALPEAEQEVRALRQLYGASQSKVYTGADAREDRVKSEASQARILHFAAHGMLNNASPMYSHLALAEGGSNEDGLLEAWELMQLDLKADLAVLSACETARGRIGAGEGMIGLSWAMFVAGVPSIVVSQWKVESAGTRDLMVNFHRALIARPEARKKAEALRQAALKLMKNPQTSHPFYWAGFILIGDSR